MTLLPCISIPCTISGASSKFVLSNFIDSYSECYMYLNGVNISLAYAYQGSYSTFISRPLLWDKGLNTKRYVNMVAKADRCFILKHDVCLRWEFIFWRLCCWCSCMYAIVLMRVHFRNHILECHMVKKQDIWLCLPCSRDFFFFFNKKQYDMWRPVQDHKG